MSRLTPGLEVKIELKRKTVDKAGEKKEGDAKEEEKKAAGKDETGRSRRSSSPADDTAGEVAVAVVDRQGSSKVSPSRRTKDPFPPEEPARRRRTELPKQDEKKDDKKDEKPKVETGFINATNRPRPRVLGLRSR